MEEKQAKKESKFKQMKRRAFMSITRKQSTKEYDEMIKRIEKETGERPNIEVRKAIRHEIAEKNAKKAEGRAIIMAATALIVGSISFEGGYALNEGSGKIEGVTKTENGVNIDISKIHGEIIIDTTNERAEAFRGMLRVTEGNEVISEHGMAENEMIDLYELRSNVIQELEVLETEEEKLNYVKEIYVEEYNKTHEEKISVENVTFYSSDNNIVYIDTAENGEKINRVCSEDYAKEHNLDQITGGSGRIINIRINGRIEEIAVGFSDRFERGYAENEEVSEPAERSISEQLGNILSVGIDYASPNGNDADKKALINAIVDYREMQIQEIIKGQLLDQENSRDGRKSNDFEIGE